MLEKIKQRLVVLATSIQTRNPSEIPTSIMLIAIDKAFAAYTAKWLAAVGPYSVGLDGASNKTYEPSCIEQGLIDLTLILSNQCRLANMNQTTSHIKDGARYISALIAFISLHQAEGLSDQFKARTAEAENQLLTDLSFALTVRDKVKQSTGRGTAIA